jgi:hypothetical protein
VKVRTSIAAVGAVALAGTGAFLLPAVASPHSTTHTLKFTSVVKKSAMFTKTTGGMQDTDVNSKGKTVGFDMIYFQVNKADTGAALHLTLDTAGGFLYGTANVNFKTDAISHGKVTGGTGNFKGATGTIKAKALNSAGSRTAVTITYRT